MTNFSFSLFIFLKDLEFVFLFGVSQVAGA